MLNSQKDIREIYNEQTYDELAEVLQKWLNPSDDDTEETEKPKSSEKSSTVSTLQSSTTTSDASAAFDDLFNS